MNTMVGVQPATAARHMAQQIAHPGAAARARCWAWPLATWGTVLVALLLSGCAAVSVSSVSPNAYLAERRGDVLTTGRLSASAQEVLRVVGIDDCRERPLVCRDLVVQASGITEERRLSVLSELWLEAALAEEKAIGKPIATQASAAPASDDPVLQAWIEAARHVWAYLFFSERRPDARAFEDRQTQVRDYYNYAVQQAVTRLFQTYSAAKARLPSDNFEVAGWTLAHRIEGAVPSRELPTPDELIAAGSLRFTGVRNTYQRDGFGASLVAVMPPPEGDADDAPYATTRFPAVTALMAFEGRTLAEVMQTRRAQIRLYDPYRTARVELAGVQAPIAGNFTAGYGLWLARSNFATQALRTLFGMSDGIVRPRVQLMQPYDPKRGIVVMLHGLASSPEAWVNVANEVLGDDALRQRYQIWQVYYPTNAPIAFNHHAIRAALDQTLAHFDPQGSAPASRDMVLVGHSLGGVLARLLVSSADQQLWAALPPQAHSHSADDAVLKRELNAYLVFKPMPQVTRAIFIAAPHRGTPFAENKLSRRIANLITLPLAMLNQVHDMTRIAARIAPAAEGAGPARIPNSIDNLSDRDPYVVAAAGLPISPQVRYHSIIGREEPEGELSASSDGVVPYTSSHLAGAESERVIQSWHSVQENPQAILEIRRILQEHLAAKGGGS